MLLRDQSLLFPDSALAEDPKQDDHDSHEDQVHDAPGDRVIGEAIIEDPEEKADHDPESSSDD